MRLSKLSGGYSGERRQCFELAGKSPYFTLTQAKEYAWTDRRSGVSNNTVRGTLNRLVTDGYLALVNRVPLTRKSHFRTRPVYPLPGMNGALPNRLQLNRAVRDLSAHYPLPHEPVAGNGVLKPTQIYFATSKFYDEQGDGQEIFIDQDAHIPSSAIDADSEVVIHTVEGVVQRQGRFEPGVHLDAFCQREPAEVVRPFHVVVRFLNLTGLFIALTRNRGTDLAENIRRSWTPCLTYSTKLYLPCSYAVYSPDGRKRVAAAFCRNIGAGRLEKLHLRLSQFDAFHIH